jgi:hypothetical protein
VSELEWLGYIVKMGGTGTVVRLLEGKARGERIVGRRPR